MPPDVSLKMRSNHHNHKTDPAAPQRFMPNQIAKNTYIKKMIKQNKDVVLQNNTQDTQDTQDMQNMQDYQNMRNMQNNYGSISNIIKSVRPIHKTVPQMSSPIRSARPVSSSPKPNAYTDLHNQHAAPAPARHELDRALYNKVYRPRDASSMMYDDRSSVSSKKYAGYSSSLRTKSVTAVTPNTAVMPFTLTEPDTDMLNAAPILKVVPKPNHIRRSFTDEMEDVEHNAGRNSAHNVEQTQSDSENEKISRIRNKILKFTYNSVADKTDQISIAPDDQSSDDYIKISTRSEDTDRDTNTNTNTDTDRTATDADMDSEIVIDEIRGQNRSADDLQNRSVDNLASDVMPHQTQAQERSYTNTNTNTNTNRLNIVVGRGRVDPKGYRNLPLNISKTRPDALDPDYVMYVDPDQRVDADLQTTIEDVDFVSLDLADRLTDIRIYFDWSSFYCTAMHSIMDVLRVLSRVLGRSAKVYVPLYPDDKGVPADVARILADKAVKLKMPDMSISIVQGAYPLFDWQNSQRSQDLLNSVNRNIYLLISV